jgi:putative ABC transport system substrate-binding protein
VFGESQREAARRAASALRIPLQAIELREPPYDYEQALAGTDGTRGDAMLITSSGFNLAEPAAEAALRHRLPGVGLWRRWVDAGFLMCYGPNLSGMYRLSAEYVDKILKGAKPADLPVQQPTKFELIVNLKTAKALGLTIPLTILGRADEVIE